MTRSGRTSFHAPKKQVRRRVRLSVKCGWSVIKKRKGQKKKKKKGYSKLHLTSVRAHKSSTEQEGVKEQERFRGVSVHACACVCEEGGVQKTLGG